VLVTTDALAPLIPPIRVLVATADGRAGAAAARTLASLASVRLDVTEGGESVAAARTLDYDFVVVDAGIASGELAAPLFDALAWRAAARRRAVEESIATESQRIARHKFRAVFNASPAPMFVAEIDSGVILDVNSAFAALTGYSVETLIGRTIADIDMWTDEHRWRLLARLTAGQLMRNVDMRLRHQGGRTRDILLSTERIDYDGEHEVCIGIATDVTELRILERNFQQAQKMEALGQLAGGVAHDFNNLLTVIGGFAELIAERDALAPDVQSDLAEILKASRTAASLTRQLLAFGRRSMMEPKITSINQSVEQMERMLRRLIGEPVTLRTKLAPDLKTVLVDPGQIDQILMNLVVNARDAMPSGGQLLIETANVVLDSEWATRHPGPGSGAFAMLAVSDTGIGMDEDVRRQLFEPFFTTKNRDRGGTGLGLAMVYGAVKQSGGSIWVYSEPGIGTTFKIYLPIVEQPPTTEDAGEEVVRSLRGTETILVVEDRDDVRRFICEALERHGYTVIESASPRETLGLMPTIGDRVQLLVTDVILPQMNGRRLAHLCHELYPQLRVLYMSGYSPGAAVAAGGLEPGLAYIQKPLETQSLLEQVRAVLDNPTPPPV
jgi:PAS domain S-box-containing protein